jgi:hypothetical protein
MLSDFEEHEDIGPLVEASKDTMMNMIYAAVINNTDKAIYNNVPPEEKVEALKNVLTYFETTEEYEKCFEIKNIIQQIKC